MLRSQDIFVLVALTSYEGQEWTYERLAKELGMSTSQIFKSLERAEAARLFVKSSRRLIRRNLVEFLVHGVRYAFAVEPGRATRGFPADWSAPGLSDLMVESDEDARVWPSPMGVARGQSIEPLHGSLPLVAVENPELHALFALIDIIRTGSARERGVAGDELQRRLG